MTLPLVCGGWGDTKCWPKRRKRRDTITDIGIVKKKSKAVPLHILEVLGGRGGIAPTHL
jgi:hypothetical protein